MIPLIKSDGTALEGRVDPAVASILRRPDRNFRFWLRLLKKSAEGARHEISCALGGIAHHRHEGISRCAQNPVLTARRAVEMASGTVPPLQNQTWQILAPPDSRLFQQPRLQTGLTTCPVDVHSFDLTQFQWTVQKDPVDCSSKSSGLMLPR